MRARWGKLREKRRKKREFLGLRTENGRKRGSKVGKIAVFCVKIGSLAEEVRAPWARKKGADIASVSGSKLPVCEVKMVASLAC